MSKHQKKGKGPRQSQNGPSFNEDALSHLTSKIDKNLSAKDHKRKQPPTNDSEKPQQKRQRNSEGGASKKLSKEEQDALLAEIKALGGDEKDLELINDVDSSDDEYSKGSTQPVDKRLKDEIAAFSKELGLADHAPSEASDVEEVEEQEEEEEEDDDDEGEDEAAEDGEASEAEEDIAGKIPGLVSLVLLFETCLTTNISKLGLPASRRLAC